MKVFDAELRQLVDDMAETMYFAPGVGLAATQLGIPLRVFVIDIAGEDQPSELRAYVNPEILETAGTQTWCEGCLSFPGVSEEVRRAATIRVHAYDVEGKPFEFAADGLLAVAIQHELDHLNGVLMIDRVGPLQKRRIGRKMSQRAKPPATRHR